MSQRQLSDVRVLTKINQACLAQLDRAAPYEGEGSGFESLGVHHIEVIMLVNLRLANYTPAEVAVNPAHVVAVYHYNSTSSHVELVSLNEDGVNSYLIVEGSVPEVVRKLNEGVFTITQHLHGDLSNVDQIRRKAAVHGTITGRS